MSSDLTLDEIGMLLKKISPDDQVRGDELAVRPEIPLVKKNAAAGFVDQARRPWLGRPRSINFAFEEQSELVGIRDRNHLNVTAFFSRSQAVREQPSPKGHILCVTELGGGNPFAMKIVRLLDSRGGTHNQ